MDAHACDMHLDSAWQDRNAVTRFSQLKIALDGKVSADVLSEMQAGLDSVGMSIRLNPYVMSLMDWSQPEIDPIRRQFHLRSGAEPCAISWPNRRREATHTRPTPLWGAAR